MQPQFQRQHTQAGSTRPGVPIPQHGTPQRGQRPAGPGTLGQPSQHQPQPVQTSQQQQQMAMQAQQDQARELAKIRSRKPTDKELSAGVGDVLIDPGVAEDYVKLRDFERRLDATMTRKRLDAIDAVTRNPKRFRTLRVWITNTVDDQAWQSNVYADTFDFSSNMESSYRVKIQGRLLDDEFDYNASNETDMAAAAEPETNGEDQSTANANPFVAQPPQPHRFSHFFKAMTVTFDQPRGTQGGQEANVEWKKPDRNTSTGGSSLPAAADFDDLTFKRNGDENTNITINLMRHEEPERYLLSPTLTEITDLTEATRAEVVMALWDYIRLVGLQEDEEKRNFRCDDLLRRLVQGESGSIPQLQQYITPHLQPLPPVQLKYTIRVDEPFHKDPQPTVYDIRVAIDDPLRSKQLLPFLQDPKHCQMLKEVAALDDQLATLIQAISSSQAKHAFFEALSNDPVGFIGDWISSQRRDLELMSGEAPRGVVNDTGVGEWRRGGKQSVWATHNARESVNVILSTKPQHKQG